jgi:hypothetical protein
MKIVGEQINVNELKQMACQRFGNLVKAVVDIEKGVMAVDSELHADEEALLIENGSRQQDLWGINIYPELKRDEWIEFDSVINLRPGEGNRSRSVESKAVRNKIVELVDKIIKE